MSQSESDLELIDMISTYRTRDFRDVRVLCVDADGEFPVIILLSDGRLIRHGKYGRFPGQHHPLDLIKVKPKHVEYRAIRKLPNNTLYLSDLRHVGPIRVGDLEAYKNATGSTLVGCVKIEYQEGQWDE